MGQGVVVEVSRHVGDRQPVVPSDHAQEVVNRDIRKRLQIELHIDTWAGRVDDEPSLGHLHAVLLDQGLHGCVRGVIHRVDPRERVGHLTLGHGDVHPQGGDRDGSPVRKQDLGLEQLGNLGVCEVSVRMGRWVVPVLAARNVPRNRLAVGQSRWQESVHQTLPQLRKITVRRDARRR